MNHGGSAGWRRRRFQDERGAVTVLLVLSLTAVLGFSAVSLDAGRLYVSRQRLQNVADAASLAGAQLLPEDETGAEEEALSYVERNGIDRANASVQVDESLRRIRVDLSGSVPLHFARVLGQDAGRVAASATAIVGVPAAIVGAQPFGVEKGDYQAGELYTLKLSSDPSQGNFHALALGGTGASVYKSNIANGYQGKLWVGDEIPTEPGNMEGPTQQAVQQRLLLDPDSTYEDFPPGSPRLLFVPIVDSFELDGRQYVRILSYAAFFLEGCVSGEISGRFVRYVADAELADPSLVPDYDMRVVKLDK